MIRGLERVVVKGKEKPIEIYEVKLLEEGTESVIIECDEKEVVRMTEK